MSTSEKRTTEEFEAPEGIGGWDETREFRLELTLAATPAQRLEWLEQAIAFAHAAGALPRRREEPDGE